ncbi:27 kDa hemolymph protein-like [Trichoplusia ni]|uniref:27 kDa hemolymph protein-like n=1 Tax=Trichoplusia ni TaxID=7111 RepID=A0A7E5WJ87_TRINI|nr:27 kDa hemolymph protein-like [Trichoplusia ni]
MLLKTLVFSLLAVAVLADDDKLQILRNYVRTQCANNNAEDKYESIEAAGKTFVECVKSIIDIPTIQREIEEAKPNGALDEVFKKYCAKSPQLKGCIHTLLTAVQPCVDSAAQNQMLSAQNSTDQLIDFVCYKDGDRIALFIAEEGPQCFQSKAEEIRTCLTTAKSSFSDLESVKKLSLAQKCAKYDELSSCIVTKLEGCDTPTPGNMAESLFRYVRKGSFCNADAKA